MEIFDFLIIGGGIIGLSIARNLKERFPEAKIVILEKESRCGYHASGRNSGVLHAGFYYPPNSLKAKFTSLGNKWLTSYCKQKKISLNQCGKLVVTKDQEDLTLLSELLKRGKENGVVLHEISAKEAQEIEPRVMTYEKAIFSPFTASVNPVEVLSAIQKDAEKEGIHIHCNVKYLKKKSNRCILTTNGIYHYSYMINASGLYADKIAKDFNFSQLYRILPFKGIYLYSTNPSSKLKTNIYPVPDLKNPFLGVHLTVTASGNIKIGPTAIPALWREQYYRLDRFNLPELMDITARQMSLFFSSSFDFKKLAWEEIKKYSKNRLIHLANLLVKDVKKEDFLTFAPAGIRAQLLNIKEKKLEMDFILEGDKESMHILNAVSPGFTSAIPFSEYVCEEIIKLVNI